ncbi:DUF2314 domain-containing protein [Vibrio lentus]|nr:DUF2314 domain-containing protein [Vibrio lentus]
MQALGVSRVLMILPTYEKDHYQLDNGEELNKEYPDSFWIPDKEVRESLKVGDSVKLIFRMEETKGSEDVSVERMWVEITAKYPNYYEGKLDNDPDGSDCVLCGQLVIFQSSHVIEVYEENT